MKVQRSVRMEKELWELADEASKKEDRSVNNIIVRWIKHGIEMENYDANEKDS